MFPQRIDPTFEELPPKTCGLGVGFDVKSTIPGVKACG
jgi:hypothetical protein